VSARGWSCVRRGGRSLIGVWVVPLEISLRIVALPKNARCGGRKKSGRLVACSSSSFQNPDCPTPRYSRAPRATWSILLRAGAKQLMLQSEPVVSNDALGRLSGPPPEGPFGGQLELERVVALASLGKSATAGHLLDLLAAYGTYTPSLSHVEGRVKTLRAEEVAWITVRRHKSL